MLIYEFRVLLPMTVEEYQVAQLWSVAEASKNETGGGEGIEVIVNEAYTNGTPLLGDKYTDGQYTHKIYHLQSKVGGLLRRLAPKGSLEIKEEAWNAYPYCRTVVSNPEYMKDNFFITIETLHAEGDGKIENAHQLTPEKLAKRVVVDIDIANDPIKSADYKPEWDPTKVRSVKANRGPLRADWKETSRPLMCAYKLVTCKFKWFGLQSLVEDVIIKAERRIFTNFHRQVFCWMDKWYGLTMEDIRAIEERTKLELDEQRQKGRVQGMIAD